MNTSQLSNVSTAKLGEAIHFAFGLSTIGQVLVAQSGHGICSVLLGTKTDSLSKELRARFPLATLKQDDAKLGPAIEAVVAFINCPNGKLNFPLDLRGSALEIEVWQALREIPVGSTSTYLDIANKVGVTAHASDSSRKKTRFSTFILLPDGQLSRPYIFPGLYPPKV